ncbi:MAG TPA: hypothetical protein PKC28_01350 [Bdellovibrionales bacterium]|nr:hypothetical protein [Bdellovibrionales bacterium]
MFQNLKLIALAVAATFTAPGFAQDMTEAESGRSVIVKPAPVENRDEMRMHVGLLAGFDNAEGGFNNTFEYGVDVGFQPYIPYGLGAELSTADEGDLTRTKLLGRGTYNFGGSIPLINRSYVGAALGPVFDSDSANDGTHLGIAPVLGFDIPFSPVTNQAISLGAQARYLFVSDAAPDSFSVNGQLKYWF